MWLDFYIKKIFLQLLGLGIFGICPFSADSESKKSFSWIKAFNLIYYCLLILYSKSLCLLWFLEQILPNIFWTRELKIIEIHQEIAKKNKFYLKYFFTNITMSTLKCECCGGPHKVSKCVIDKPGLLPGLVKIYSTNFIFIHF